MASPLYIYIYYIQKLCDLLLIRPFTSSGCIMHQAIYLKRIFIGKNQIIVTTLVLINMAKYRCIPAYLTSLRYTRTAINYNLSI